MMMVESPTKTAAQTGFGVLFGVFVVATGILLQNLSG